MGWNSKIESHDWGRIAEIKNVFLLKFKDHIRVFTYSAGEVTELKLDNKLKQITASTTKIIVMGRTFLMEKVEPTAEEDFSLENTVKKILIIKQP